ncbi:hypothetical protein [Sphingomonas alpina]|uniref:Uncharacterized protein n=2 Tax=Sphingomonas alpina TaxID=653931 RepID=A0A7H0LR06_9SPHN|nr:hypothetical protein [Sphingomonas alpina]QNQ12109.1 hypothetical protein H3Z74_18910 [Sphingomonas alpina]
MDIDSIKRAYQVREGYWFAPKLFGLGATPATWQGWVLTLAYSAAMLATLRLLPGLVPRIIVCLALTAAYVSIAARKTEGGWHWRWGGK